MAKPRKTASMQELREMIAEARRQIAALPQGRIRDNRTARLDQEERRLFGARSVTTAADL
jgi:hypothetical protein